MSINFPFSSALETFGQILGIGISGLVGLIVVYRKYLKGPLKELGELSGIPKEVQKISQQLERNGGSTLADKVARIEENLGRMEARQKHHLFHRTTPGLGLFETDPLGKWIIINPVITELFGKPDYEIVGQGWINSLPSPDRYKIWQNYLDAIANERIFESNFKLHNHLEGGFIHVNMKLMPLKANSQLFGWCGELKIQGDPAYHENVTG